MTYISAPLMGLAITLLNILCPVIVLFVIPFAKWDTVPTIGVQHGLNANPSIIRGDLPGWLSWFSTPDERLPGGMYEPTVLDIYTRYGKWVCAWYWLGVRNVLMGLAVWAGKTTTDYIPDEPPGFWQRGDIWRYSIALGPVKFVTGYQVYKSLDGTFQAAPVLTVKKNIGVCA